MSPGGQKSTEDGDTKKTRYSSQLPQGPALWTGPSESNIPGPQFPRLDLWQGLDFKMVVKHLIQCSARNQYSIKTGPA